MTYIELLSPAKDLECGIAAIDHGADAVYIGASRFGARAAAGNSVEDIGTLCQYAHQFGAKVYVTVNTILYDNELDDTRALIWQLYDVGVDALIVQDLALLKMDLPPIPLHASTQMDNRTPEKALALQQLGFQQIVLARELSVNQIREIHKAVPETPLEAFCHGALCVSYSGRCYSSQYCFGRSANRGECAQFCRLPFTLKDADGETVVNDRYLLSLLDMNRSQSLEEMMDAGVRSFKIEGRLKDVAYVKNVTAYYRQRIDEVLKRRKEYSRSSFGDTELTFVPNPAKSFARGFTEYFLHERTPRLSSMDTPKSRGQEVGFVKEGRRDCIIVAGTASFANGDGLCYLDEQGKLQGFRVNRVEGNHLYPAEMPAVRKGDTLWRNFDQEWERMMSRKTAFRRIPCSIRLEEVEQGFQLSVRTQDGRESCETFNYEHQLARTDQTEGIKEVLSKLGDTVYMASHVQLFFTKQWFIPRSLLAEWRRAVVTSLTCCCKSSYNTLYEPLQHVVSLPTTASYQNNVSNHLSLSVYQELNAKVDEMAFELQPYKNGQKVPVGKNLTLMTCKYCIRHEMGLCPKQRNGRTGYKEPLYLESRDGRRFRLEFDCRNCEMKVLNA